MKAMIFAAGLGTRLKPLTDHMPKALVPVSGKPLIQWQIDKLFAAGCTDLTVNVHHFADMLEEYLSAHTPQGMTLHISDERNALLDTGGGLKKAASLLSDGSDGRPILIHNTDILSNAPLQEFYAQNLMADATLLVSNRKTTRYLLFNDEGLLMGWTNVQTGEVRSPHKRLNPAACHKYAFSGIHLFSPRLFPLMDAFPGKFGIIDFYLSVCSTCAIKADVRNGLRLLDVGKQDTLSAADAFVDAL